MIYFLFRKLNVKILASLNVRFVIHCILIVFSSFVCISSIYGQSVINIKVTASVPDISEIDIIVVNALTIDETKAVNGRLIVQPDKDAEAGMIRIKGSPLARFSLLFMDFMELGQVNTDESLRFKFKISGYHKDNQQASQYLDPLIRELNFSDTGEYFLWIGGEMNLSGINPGNYEGIFAFEIEYL